MKVLQPGVRWRACLPSEAAVRIAPALVLGVMGLLYFWYGLPGGSVALNDFGSFWASGRAALDGGNPYGVHDLTFRVSDGAIAHPNLNPPVSLLLFAPLSSFEPNTLAKGIWWFGLLAYAAVVAAGLRWQPDREMVLPMAAWAAALPAFWDGLRLGQVYPFLLVFVAGALYLLEHRREVLAGMLIGAFVAFKPNFLFWPLVLFLSGHRSTAGWSLAWFVGFSLFPLLVFGHSVYEHWFDIAVLEAGNRKGVFLNASIMAVGYRAGSSLLAITLLVIVLAWTVLQIRSRRLTARAASAMGIALGIVLSPVVWFHYVIFLVPAMVAGRWNPRLLAGAILVLIPVPLLFMIHVELDVQDAALRGALQATLGSAFSWGALLLLAGLARDPV